MKRLKKERDVILILFDKKLIKQRCGVSWSNNPIENRYRKVAIILD